MITLHGYFFSASRRLFFKSNGVLCFQGSRNCKKELNYADGQTKSIVPVMCEKGFKAQGWLGIITAGLLWIDFRYIDKYSLHFVPPRLSVTEGTHFPFIYQALNSPLHL